MQNSRCFYGATALRAARLSLPGRSSNDVHSEQSRVEAALENIKTLVRPGKDGYATIWDGNKYVQCKYLKERVFRCEAAGTLMQPSLDHVLTAERVDRLKALGWLLDPSFGNYVESFPTDAPASLVADKI